MQDLAGQEMIRQWNEFIRQFGVFSSVVFLSDYDMQLTQQMVRGVDVWINTPHRPWEASGTSGMKVLANGGLNLSEIDGWWEEPPLRKSAGLLAMDRNTGTIRPGMAPKQMLSIRFLRSTLSRNFSSGMRTMFL